MNEPDGPGPLRIVVSIALIAILAAAASALAQNMIAGDVHPAITGGVTGGGVGAFVPGLLARRNKRDR